MNHGVERLWGWTVVPTQAVHLMGSTGLYSYEAAPFHKGLCCPPQKEQVEKRSS